MTLRTTGDTTILVPALQNALYANPFSEITCVLEWNSNCNHASEYTSLSSLNVNHTCTFAWAKHQTLRQVRMQTLTEKKKKREKDGRAVFGVFKQDGMLLYDFQYHSPPTTSTKLKTKIKHIKRIQLRTRAATARYWCYLRCSRTFYLLPSCACRCVISSVILCSEPPFCT